jgi:4-amino-4-deoxy-L-arabinose transferase-like glycosyltransferase
MLIGPVSWALDEGISYAIDQHACSTGHFYVLHITTAACFVLALTGAFVGWRQFSKIPNGNEEGGSPRDRSWFMALLGILLSLGFALVIIAMAVPKIILSPCD